MNKRESQMLNTRWTKRMLPVAIACFTVGMAVSANAQQIPSARLAARHSMGADEIAAKYNASGPAGLTARELIDFVDFDGRRGVPITSDVFFGPLAWSWAAERGLDAQTAIAELVDAYSNKFGAAPEGIAAHLTAQLAGLPVPGRAIYHPPAYIPTNVQFPTRRVYGVAGLPLGPIEKNGISWRSIRDDDPVRRALITGP